MNSHDLLRGHRRSSRPFCPLGQSLSLAAASTVAFFAALSSVPIDAAEAEAPNEDDRATIVFQGNFPTTKPDPREDKPIYQAHLVSGIEITQGAVQQTNLLSVQVIQGKIKELVFSLQGQGDISTVEGSALLGWGIRRDTHAQRFLVLHVIENPVSPTNWTFAIGSRLSFTNPPVQFEPVSLAPANPALFDGFLQVRSDPALTTTATNLHGLTPIDSGFFPADNPSSPDGERKPLTFRFAGEPYALTLVIEETDPDLNKIRFESFQLSGQIAGRVASFELSGTALVRHPNGGVLEVLSGEAGLTSFEERPNMRLALENGHYQIHFTAAGTYTIGLSFDARVAEKEGWNHASFAVPGGALRPVTLQGLTESTELRLGAAAEARREGTNFLTYLPASGPLELQWQDARPEEEGKLFFAVNGNAQIAVSPGLLRQTHVFDYRVMQGELLDLALDLDGVGEVTRVQGEGILSWQVRPGTGPDQRQLEVKLNQPRTDTYALTVQTQTPLGTFPLSVTPLRIVPREAIRFGGHLRVVNSGAVRLEILSSAGLAQISSTRFPAIAQLEEALGGGAVQIFAFRFSGNVFGLEIQADHVLPEVSVSQLVVYHLAETEFVLEAELELDIREAPLREFDVLIPAGYSVARLHAPNLSDYHQDPADDSGGARLSMQFGQPLQGHHVVQLRLTRSHDGPEPSWALFPLQPLNVKSVRGYVGMGADPGWRLIEAQTAGLTEIATAFFPKKIKDLQLAYRLRESAWSASLNTERLALSIQVDSLQLFSMGEGLVYGSTVLNYLIAGAPVSVLQLAVPTNFANVEFVGRDVRHWRQTTNGYEVSLHNPVSGTYSLLATYDLQFNRQGDLLSLPGMQPLGVQSEQGHVLLISPYQFQVEPVSVSPGLIPIEPGEIPSEYRLLFDNPILKAYQFASRPFDLQLRLTALPQGETVNQVVDRATFRTRVSAEGQALTEVIYLIKSQGQAHLRVSMPSDTTLWSVEVRGERVVPVTDQQSTLIPLPQDAAPNTVLPVSLKLAVKSPEPGQVRVALPRVAAPILLSDWQLTPDPGHRLTYRGGNVTPPPQEGNATGFAWFLEVLGGANHGEPAFLLLLTVLSMAAGVAFGYAATRPTFYRWSAKNIAGLGLSAGCFLLGFIVLSALLDLAGRGPRPDPVSLSFLLPVQSPNEGLAVTLNNFKLTEAAGAWWRLWPAALGVFAWAYFLIAHQGMKRQAGLALGWTLIAWGCLRLPGGAQPFLILTGVAVVMRLLLPLYARQKRLPKRPSRRMEPAPNLNPQLSPETEEGAPGPATSLWWIGPLVGALIAGAPARSAAAPTARKVEPVVESLVQSAEVIGQRVRVHASLRWRAEAGQSLDFLHAPAVLTSIDFPKAALELVQETVGEGALFRLNCNQEGRFEVQFHYELPVIHNDASRGFHLPTRHGLVNRVSLTVDRSEIELVSPDAVSIRPVANAGGAAEAVRSRFELVLAPVEKPWVAWQPRTRDISAEKAVFYAELFHLILPTAGLVEGVHDIQIRPAQGQVRVLTLSTPVGLTITDAQAPGLVGWTFDPDSRQARVQFDPASSKPFTLRLTSQITTGPLPYTLDTDLIRVEGSAEQVAMVGLATGNEVQLDRAEPSSLSPMNLEDFPPELLAARADQVSGLTLRRGFRSSDPAARLALDASAVAPDVRVLSQQTLSLGEDRSVLAAQWDVQITRAGVFKLSFALPDSMDVESLTGETLSHWTELARDGQRIITLHLKEKTEGQARFAVSLAGAGVPSGPGWLAPRLSLREASKETGQLIVVPEQGMRLEVASRDGVSQLDPKSAGIRQQGVLVFRLLQQDWQLGFDVERVDPWVQVSSLLDVTLLEGHAKVAVTFQYQIENAGLKSLFLQLPAAADAVRFSGDQVADAVKSPLAAGDSAEWEVKLDRRVIGAYRLQLNYQLPLPEAASQVVLGAVQANQVNLHRAYLTLRTGGRLQLTIPSVPPSLQPADWRSLPSDLRAGKSVREGHHTFRAVESDFQLNVQLVRHEAERLLPARIESTEMISLLSDSGEMLTQVRLTMQPGDKRMLGLQLPDQARFWFAFVNEAGVWPWRQANQILIPIEPHFNPGQPTSVELFYSLPTAGGRNQAANFKLAGPQFDLPLENISWKVFLPHGRKLDDWEGDLQLVEALAPHAEAPVDLQSYMDKETLQQQQQTREAESMLDLANSYLAQGRQEQARKAFQSAWNLSQHDDAFNEDARVQLQNIKMQQALVGLNVRRNAIFQSETAGEGGTNLAANMLQANQAPQYTQQQAQHLLEQNPAEENTALMTVAQQLIEQQDNAQVAPDTIRASLPEQGNLVTFTRSLLVDPYAGLKLNLETRPVAESRLLAKIGLIVLTFTGFFVLLTLGRLLRRETAPRPLTSDL